MTLFPQAAQGTLKYNGFTFPPAVHTTVHASPVQDSSGRFTKYIKYVITAEFMLYPGVDSDTSLFDVQRFPDTTTGTDVGMSALRSLLTEQGKTLEFNGKGYGSDFTINTGAKWDVSYGPVPKILIWDPVGANQVVRCVWAVEVHTTECSGSVNVGRISEFNYGIEYSIDDEGLTTRTVSGLLEIGATLVSGVTPYQADAYRDRINIEVPLGFKRESQRYDISPDRKVLSFQVVDRELPAEFPYHNGLSDIRVNHTIQSIGNYVSSKWLVSLNGSFRVAAGQDKGLAWAAFLHYVKSRRDAAIQHSELEDPKRPYRHVYPVQLIISDDVTGRGFRASLSWMIFTTFKQVFKAGGMFLRPGQSSTYSWEYYRRSMSKTWSQRGFAELVQAGHLNARLPSTCGTQATPNIVDTRKGSLKPATYLIFDSQCPEPQYSYDMFEPHVEVLTDTMSEPLFPTGGKSTWKGTPADPRNTKYTGNGYEELSSSKRDVVHYQRGHHRTEVLFSGYARRWCYPVDNFTLESYGGLKATPIGKHIFKVEKTKDIAGKKYYAASWEQRYVLEDGIPKGTTYEVKPSFERFSD